MCGKTNNERWKGERKTQRRDLVIFTLRVGGFWCKKGVVAAQEERVSIRWQETWEVKLAAVCGSDKKGEFFEREREESDDIMSLLWGDRGGKGGGANRF